MRRGRRASAASMATLAAALAGAGPPPAKAPPEPAVKAEPLPERAVPNPIQTVRVFSALQERIVNGSIEALRSQAGLAREIGSHLLKFDAAAWKDTRNREAAIKFALMGGDPRVIEELEAKKTFEGVEATLANGALAFAYGDRKQAEADFRSIDPRSLTPGVGAYVALITAVLVGPSDPLKALALCDEARLLSPSTAVEEAALRLTIELAILANAASRFDAAVVRHLRRFPNSLYAQTIDTRVARVLAARNPKLNANSSPLIAIASDDIPAERRLGLLTELTKAALRGGSAEMAAIAAGQLRTLATDDAALVDLCRAAETAFALLSGRRTEARVLLAEPVSDAASTEVKALIGELRALLAMIEEPPKAAPQSPVQASVGRQAEPSQDRFARFAELAKQVETVLGDADKLLRKAGS